MGDSDKFQQDSWRNADALLLRTANIVNNKGRGELSQLVGARGGVIGNALWGLSRWDTETEAAETWLKCGFSWLLTAYQYLLMMVNSAIKDTSS